MNKILYKKDSKNKIREWAIQVTDSTIIINHGLLDGKKVEKIKQIKTGKNIGKKNETTPEEQAVLEATSTWQKQKDKGYFETIEEAKTEQVYLPMLAHMFTKRKHNIVYPAYVQPKLDGCFFRTTKIITDQGIKTIEDIVENKLKIKVLSYNKKTGKNEFKSIINWFNNGKINYKEWVEINPKYGHFIKCTPNHKFYTEKGRWKSAEDLDKEKDKIMSINCNEYRNKLMAGTLLGDSSMSVEKRGNKISYRISFCHTNLEYFKYKVKTLNIEGKVSPYISGYGSNGYRFISVALTNTDFPINKFYFMGHNTKAGQRKLISYKTLIKYINSEALSLWIADDGSLAYNNKNKYTPILSLATHSFSDEQLNHILKYFKLKWGCVPFIYKDKKVKSNGKFLTFSIKDTLFILNQLKKYQCKGVEYKYYFPTEDYIQPADFIYKFTSFKKRKSHRMPKAVKYDIEVEDNHNYFVNGILVHNCRVLAKKVSEFDIDFMSRGGKKYEVLQRHSLREELLTKMKVGEIYDGEIYKHGWSLQRIVSAVKKFSKDTLELEYWVYDKAIPGTFEGRFLIRRKQNGQDIKYVETYSVYECFRFSL